MPVPTTTNNPGLGSINVGNVLNSFTNPGLNREYAFNVNVSPFVAPPQNVATSSQAGTPYAVGNNQLNKGITGTLVTGSDPNFVSGQFGTSNQLSVLSNGTTGAGDFSDKSSQIVSLGSGNIGTEGGIRYHLALPSDITSIQTNSEWQDTGRVNQDYTVLTSTDGVNFHGSPGSQFQ